jgi:hypothetical protein
MDNAIDHSLFMSHYWKGKKQYNNICLDSSIQFSVVFMDIQLLWWCQEQSERQSEKERVRKSQMTILR